MQRISSAATANDLNYQLRNQEVKVNQAQNQMGTQQRLQNLRDDPIAAAHFGVEASEPLIAAPAGSGALPAPLVRVEPAGVIVTALKPSEDGKAWIIRLFGASGEDQSARLVWSKPVSVTYSDVDEQPGKKAPESIPVSRWSLVTLRAERL